MIERLERMLGRVLGWFDELPEPEGTSAAVHWTSENAELVFTVAALVVLAWAVLMRLWRLFW